MSCENVVDILKPHHNHISQQLVVTDDKGIHVKGVVTLDALLSNLISGTVKRTDIAEKTMLKQFTKITASTTLGKVSRILEKESYAVVVNDDDALVGVVTQNDIFNFITKDDCNAK